MNLGFWEKLSRSANGEKRAIIALAPMADVTDPAFRKIIAKYSKINPKPNPNLVARPLSKTVGGLDVMWTEFVSADGLVRAPEKGKQKLLRDLLYTENERPIVAQFFTGNSMHMEQASRIARELGFDGIDINMGCPDKGVEKQGAGASLIKNPKQAREVIAGAKRGAGNLPVSVKTRTGYNKDELDTWLPELLAEEPALITIHARTRKEMSKVPARWGDVARAVKIRDDLKSKTLILGNGDLKDVPDALEKIKESGADGAMLGRAVFGNPWVGDESSNYGKDISLKNRLLVLIEHIQAFDEILGDIKSFAIMKKHFKSYIHAFPESHALRTKLMETENAKQAENTIADFLKNGLK